MKKTINQETFDDVVQENMETFDLSKEEAVKAAIEEFKIQGVDLSNIVTQITAKTIVQQHPLTQHITNISSLVGKENTPKLEHLCCELDQMKIELQKLLNNKEISIITNIVESYNLVTSLLHVLDGGYSPSVTSKLIDVILLILKIGKLKQKFEKENGTSKIRVLIFSQIESECQEQLFKLGEILCINSKDSKAIFMNDNGAYQIVQQFKQIFEQSQYQLMINYCNFIISLVTADDPSAPTSGVFKYVRALAKQEIHLQILTILQNDNNYDNDLMISLLSLIRKVCVNDEICKQVGLNNGIQIVKTIMENNFGNVEVVNACVSFVRQLAISDDLKSKIVNSGFTKIVFNVMLIGEQNDKILENCCAILSSVMLRNPDNSQKLYGEGFGDVLVNILNDYSDKGNVMRQVCQVIRNMVVRNPDLRDKMIQKDIIQKLQFVKKQYHRQCGDVAMAALRDLGVENYGE